jgi:hypothetical protein
MWLPWRRRRDQAERELDGGPPVRGPEFAYYQYFFGDFSMVSRNGGLTLTATHVIFDGVAGADVVVPLPAITAVRDQPIRRWHRYGHGSQLIIRTRSGQIGFLLDDPAGWAESIRDQVRVARGPHPERSGG